MIIPYSQIVGSKIYGFESGKVLGEVEDIVIAASTMELEAIVLKSSIQIFSGKKIVSNIDIIGILPDGIAIKDESVIVPLYDNPTVKDWIKSGFIGLKQKVITKSKSMIGYVSDYTINSDTLIINNFHTTNLFTEKIVNVNSIIEYRKKLIVIKDEFENIKISPLPIVDLAE